MDENLPNSFMGYFLEGPFSTYQRFNMSFSQRLGLKYFQVVNLSFPSQLLGLWLDLNVNTSLSAPKLEVKLQINMRLWTNGKPDDD